MASEEQATRTGNDGVSQTDDMSFYRQRGREETVQRLDDLRIARGILRDWMMDRKRTHPQFGDAFQDTPFSNAVSEKMYEALIDVGWRDAEAGAWYAVQHPVLCILYETGVSYKTIENALKGVDYLRSFGINMETDLISNPRGVSKRLDAVQDEQGINKDILFHPAARGLERLCLQDGGYRPGMLVLLDRELDTDIDADGVGGFLYGFSSQRGVVIGKPDPDAPTGLLAAHELIHYLQLDGRKPFDADMGHCFTTPCLMNVDQPTPSLCGHHQATVQGYHAGVMDALEKRGIRRERQKSGAILEI